MAIDEQERRQDLAVRVALLDERTHSIKETVGRVETALLGHVKEEEMAFHSMDRFKGEIKDLLEDHKDSINEKLDPMVSEWTRYKGMFGGVAFIVSAVWAFVVVFKDKLVGMLTQQQ